MWGVSLLWDTVYIHMKSSFPKRDMPNLKKMSSSCHFAVYWTYSLLHQCFMPNRYISLFKMYCKMQFFSKPLSAEPVFSLNAIYPLDQSEFVWCNPTCLCSVFTMSALNSNNTFDGLDEPVRPTPGGRKRRLDKENHKKQQKRRFSGGALIPTVGCQCDRCVYQ